MADASEDVSVELIDDVAPITGPVPGVAAGRSGGPGPRRRVGLLAALVAAVVGGLLLWPEPGGTEPGGSEPGAAEPAAEAARRAVVPPPGDPRLLPWPGRGPAVTDQGLLDDATDAWRESAASGTEVDDLAGGPGPEVHPLWAGTVGRLPLVLLQSVGVDDVARVAQVTQVREPGPLEVVNVAEITAVPEFLVLTYTGWLDVDRLLRRPGTALVQLLPSPALLAPDEQLKRLEGQSFRPIGIQDNELSQPWVHSPWQSASGPLVLRTRDVGLEPGVMAASSVVPGELLPAPPAVEMVPPAWGPTRRDLPEDYLDALTAVASAGLDSARVAILGATMSDRGRASLVEVRADAASNPVVVTVVRDGSRVDVSAPRPAGRPSDVALGAVGTLAGETVVVAAGPPDTSLIVLGADGDAVGTGPRTAAVVLDRDRDVREVAAQGYRKDESFVGRTVLDVSDL